MPSPWVPAGSGGGLVDSVSGAAPVTSTGGVNPIVGINAATDLAPGSLSAADKTKLDGLTPGAAVASVSGAAPIVSSGGTTPAISITPATDLAPGSLSAADKTKLDGLASCEAHLTSTIGQYACAENDKSVATGYASHAEGATRDIGFGPLGSRVGLALQTFTIPAGGTLVTIAGNVVDQFERLVPGVRITPSAPVALPTVTGLVNSTPTFAAGNTTFNLAVPIDGSTTGGTIVQSDSVEPAVISATMAAGGTLMTMNGDQTARFIQNQNVFIHPTSPFGTQVTRIITSAVVFAAGFTTFSIDSAIDTVTIIANIGNAFGRGYGAHVEGIGGVAEGLSSHVEGVGCVVGELGFGAHAEGVGTNALSRGSHAEGWSDPSFYGLQGPIAYQVGSHAEGQHGVAGGDSSHSEGVGTFALGFGSHSQGFDTSANGDFSHAGGSGSRAGYIQQVFTIAAGGTVITIVGDATAQFVNGNNISLFPNVPTVKVVPNAIVTSVPVFAAGNTTFNINVKIDDTTTGGWCIDTSFGKYSHAQGFGVVARGFYSHAGGKTTQALGLQSFAHGDRAVASGDTSVAFGQQTTASGACSFVAGKSNTAGPGEEAFAEGVLTVASGIASHAEGKQTQATADQAHAEGLLCIASGIQSHAGGTSSTASGGNSFAYGFTCLASGSFSSAFGDHCTANNTNATARGNTSTASGTASFASGFTAVASGSNAHALGQSVTASGLDSFCGGSTSTAAGQWAFCYGLSSSAAADLSIAMGFQATCGAAANASAAIGETVTANGRDSQALGLNCTADGIASRAVGSAAYALKECDYARGGGRFAINGDAQVHYTIFRGATPGAAPAEAVKLATGTLAGTVNVLTTLKRYYVTVTAIASKLIAQAGVPDYITFDFVFVATVNNAGVVTFSAVVNRVAPIVGGAGLVGSTLVPATTGANNFTLTFTVGAGLTTACRINADVKFVEHVGS